MSGLLKTSLYPNKMTQIEEGLEKLILEGGGVGSQLVMVGIRRD
jgi:hypothetical protein